jgi:uncharacterized protein with von Willebrand factor type A (vWA) domain
MAFSIGRGASLVQHAVESLRASDGARADGEGACCSTRELADVRRELAISGARTRRCGHLSQRWSKRPRRVTRRATAPAGCSEGGELLKCLRPDPRLTC